ncbi:MAG TPA: aspartate aminotransferase family protein [Candidatus Competibacteraceae bacterium]|nr:aspartate aminotransferase family protein [Candidatus Competibacteraceae bacterium]
MSNAELHALDRAYVLHPSTHAAQHARGEAPNRIITGGQGVYIVDDEGQRSLDAFAGLYCVNIGYGRNEVADAISEQAHKLAYYHTYVGHSNEQVIRLSERIVRKAGMGMTRVYYGLSGSDANETNIKLVWYYNNVLGRPEKKKIISRWRGYHGSGIMTGSLTGLELFHKLFDLPRAPILHTTCPHYYWNGRPGESEREFAQRCADELEQLILVEGPDTVAAFIGEPVLGTGGIIPPPQGYWEAIQAVLRKYDVLLIADEVVTGFGRTGQYFGCHTYGIQPDLITVAKGMSSGYLPISGVIVGERVWKVLEQGNDTFGPLGHGWTYSAHPVCAAAANANLDIVEREDLTGNARRVGAYLLRRLHETLAEHPMVGEVRGVGLLAALEFVADKQNKQRFDPALKIGPRVSAEALKRGMIARAMPQGDILGFAPPLVLSEAEADEIVRIAREAVEAVYREL